MARTMAVAETVEVRLFCFIDLVVCAESFQAGSLARCVIGIIDFRQHSPLRNLQHECGGEAASTREMKMLRLKRWARNQRETARVERRAAWRRSFCARALRGK